MPISSNISLGGSGKGTAAKKDFGPRKVVKKGNYQVVLKDIKSKKEGAYGEPDRIVEKLLFIFEGVQEGPAKGVVFFVSANPSISAGGEGSRESNLHALVKYLIRGDEFTNPKEPSGRELGDPLTPAQINALRKNPTLLNELRLRQLTLTIEVKKRGDGEPGNKVKAWMDVAPEDYIEYTPEDERVDPRNLEDPDYNPKLVCERHGTPIAGYERRDGTWVSQKDAAESSVKRYGGVYGPRAISEIKEERATEDEEGLPF